MKKILLSMMLGFAASAACAGSFRLRNVFSDGMVLQRDAPIVFASSLFNRDGYPALPFKLSPPAHGNQ